MKKKLIGIFVCMLLIAATGITVAGTIENKGVLKLNQDMVADKDSSSSIAQPQGKGTVIVKEFIKGAQIAGTNGLRIGPDGNLYTASVFGHEIVVMDPKRGDIIDRIGPERGVEGPDDLAFGPDGSLYWTDIILGEVGRLKPDGTFTKQYIAPYVNPITFNDDGRLFVGQAFYYDGLYELDPELIDPPIKRVGVGNPAFSLNAFDFGPDGLLYAPQHNLNRVVRINVDTADVEVVTNELAGMCKFDSNGELYLAEDIFVYHCDVDTGACTIVAECERRIDNLAFDANDQIYISNFVNGSIYKIKKSGKEKLLSSSGMIAPGGIAILSDNDKGHDESIFVADFWSLKEFDLTTGKPKSTSFFGLADGPLTASPDGDNIVMSTWFGDMVMVWNPETKTVVEANYFNIPINAVRFGEDLVVAELGSGSVVCQDHDTGSRTTIASGLFLPTGLAYTDDDLWVAEWYTGVVYQIVADGIVLSSKQAVASGLANPEGMVVDSDGNLLVVESGAGRLTKIDLETGEKNVLVEDLPTGEPATPGLVPCWTLSDVAVDKDGYIYVSTDLESYLYRIRVVPPLLDHPFLNWLFEHFPNLLPILRLIGFL
jgi:sugar lactone lactonase YvrE